MGIIDLSQLSREPAPQPRPAEMFDNLAEVQVNSALELAAQVPDAEVAAMAEWLLDYSQVVTVFTDQRGQPMIPESQKPVRIAFVGDDNPVLSWYPGMRQKPTYVPNLRSIFIPDEARSHSVVLAAILMHEGKHDRNYADPDFAARAHAIFPNTTAEEATNLVTEVEAFSLEGKLLEDLLGEDFAAYLQAEVDAADKNAIENQKTNNGLLMQTGIDPQVVREALKNRSYITSDQAERFCLRVLAVAVPMYASFRTVDQIFDRNDMPEDIKTDAKVRFLGSTDYLY